MLVTTLLGVFLLFSSADAASRNTVRNLRLPVAPVLDGQAQGLDETAAFNNTIYYFDQLKDHNNPSLGTFKQRFWMNWEFYELGGPIILFTPGEANAEAYQRYLTNATLAGMIGQQQNGANIVLEHRFFGLSNPYDNLTSQSLELLTVQQAIGDLVYFAENANLPMPGGEDAKPNTNKWVLIGGSYSGALTSWTMISKPGVFYAAYASSAVVEAITDYYGYFTPIHEHMPKNCSSDVEAVVAYLDQMYAENNTAALQTLKETFGLGNLSHIDDFAAALQTNLFDWQSLQPRSGNDTMFFKFCDALEVKDGKSAPASGWGLENAIHSWGSFWNTTYYNYTCGDKDAETCLGTYDANESYYTNVSVNNAERSWFWMVCSQLGWYQVGPPLGQPAIVSRILQPTYWERQCVMMFPEKFSSPPTPPVGEVNDAYGGWNISVDRLFFANGLRDPWRGATVSADSADKMNTTMQPIYESNGFHTSDLLTSNGLVDDTVLAVQLAGLAHMKEWLTCQDQNYLDSIVVQYTPGHIVQHELVEEW